MKTSKKVVLLFIIAAITLAALSVAAAGNSPFPNEIAGLNGEIMVNGEIIDAPIPYVYGGNPDIVMVPLRAIAESLGYTVLWEIIDGKNTIILGYGIQMWIGADYYRVGQVTQVQLYPAPELVNSRTFLSLDFFEHVLGYDAYIHNGTVIVEQNLTSATWVAPDAAVIWFAEGSPAGMFDGMKTINVGKTPDDDDVFAFVRIPLGADWFADEVTDARLFLKVTEGTPQSELYIGIVTDYWSHMTDLETARAAVDHESLIRTEIRLEHDGWVSMDVTDIVVSWLRSESPNRGFALFPGDEQTLGVFVSGMEAPVRYAPRIVVSGEIGERPLTYGRFGFTRQPAQGVVEPMDGGNCFSYALRDLDAINLEDVNISFHEIARIFAEQGMGGVLEHTAEKVEDYVERHREGLQISSFRRIEYFDSPIDAETEYRIALRVSVEIFPDGSLHPMRGYDYHFWAQLNDGRWTQTNPAIFSEIIPYIGPGVCPARFDWDAGTWNVERYQSWYRSDIVFFAVTKDTDEFTRHKE